MTKTNTSFDPTEQMFAAVGRAITQWSFLEAQLCQLFSVCVGTAVTLPSGGIRFVEAWVPMWVFYSVENFRSKLSMVDAALTARAYAAQTEEIQADWARLSEKARRLSLRRNKLAHWTVLPHYRIEEQHFPARLTPPYGSPSYYRETGPSPLGRSLSTVQIGHLELAFSLYGGKLREFTQRVADTQALRDRDVQQALHLLILDGRLDPTVTAALRHALASQE